MPPPQPSHLVANLLCGLLLLLPVLSNATPVQPKITQSKPYKHKATGLSFHRRLLGLTLQNKTAQKHPKSKVTLHYIHKHYTLEILLVPHMGSYRLPDGPKHGALKATVMLESMKANKRLTKRSRNCTSGSFRTGQYTMVPHPIKPVAFHAMQRQCTTSTHIYIMETHGRAFRQYHVLVQLDFAQHHRKKAYKARRRLFNTLLPQFDR